MQLLGTILDKQNRCVCVSKCFSWRFIYFSNTLVTVNIEYIGSTVKIYVMVSKWKEEITKIIWSLYYGSTMFLYDYCNIELIFNCILIVYKGKGWVAIFLYPIRAVRSKYLKRHRNWIVTIHKHQSNIHGSA